MVPAAPFRSLLSVIGIRLLTLSLLGRLPMAMCPIGSLLMVSKASGSIAAAGLVSGTLALGEALGGPAIGRLADRKGQRVIMPPASILNGSAIVLLVVASVSDWAIAAQAAIAAAVGISTPQIGPLSRTRWLVLTKGHADERRLVTMALSADSALDQIAFTLGPVVVGIVATLVHPIWGLLVAALLVIGCGLPFALHPSGYRTQDVSDPGYERRGARLLAPNFVLLCTGMAMQGVLFGSLQIGLTSITEKLGNSGAAGLLYGLMGGVSAATSIVITLLPPRIDLTLRLKLATLGLVMVSLPLLAVQEMTSLTLVMALLGLAIAPHIITLFGLTERAVPQHRMGEAMTILVASVIVFQAMGSTVAGWLGETHGPTAAFALTCTAAAATVVVAATAGTRRYGRSAPA